jgi:AGZA family xanthine/uracil permease-like MFS transporter
MISKKNQTEITAGITTFFTAMYIIVVNPAILAPAGFDYNQSLTATVMVSAFSSTAMGWYAKNPILVAPGMGINAFIAVHLINHQELTIPIALGAIFWSGIIFLLLSVFDIRSNILKAMHENRLRTTSFVK